MGGILLDTNVLSELMRPKPTSEVLSWFEQRPDAAFFISAITCAEILLGIALLPTGKRRDGLANSAEKMFSEDFAGRSLAFDEACAADYALLVATRTRQGRAISTEDAQIAAIALTHHLPLATRNGKDFKDIEGLVVLDPWR
ncbi:MAG TPA: type II toxin-antitoxin system VapC family toxin [Thiobacillus sp.]